MKPLTLRYSPDGPPLSTTVEQLLTATCDTALNPVARPWQPANSSVVSFVGGRGAGKTTSLGFACEYLSDAGHRVLPLIEPDMFIESESLATAIIQAIRLNAKPEQTVERSDFDNRCRALLRRAAVARSTGFRPVGPLDQQAMDESRATEVASVFSSEWADLVATVTTSSSALVVPVDDLDLSFERLADLLDDLKLLAAAPNVVFLVAADIDECRRLLQARHHRLLGEIEQPIPYASSGPDGRRYAPSWQPTVEGQLAKILPRDARVFLEPLAPEDRLRFVPVGSRESILDLLRKLELPGFEGTPTMASLFALEEADALIPTGYALVIPDNRRMLAALHSSLARAFRSMGDRTIDADRQASDRNRAAAQTLLSYGLEAGLSQTAMVGLRGEDFLYVDAAEGGEPVLSIDFSLLTYVGTTRQLMTTESRGARPGPDGKGPASEVELLVAGRIYATLKDDGPRVGAALSHVMILARDLSVNYGLPCAERILGTPPRRSGRAALLRVVETDHDFLRLPLWDGYLDPWVFDRTWQRVFATADASDRASGGQIAPVAISTAALLDAWRTIASVHERRAGPDGPLAAETCGNDGWAVDLDRTWDALRAAYERATARVLEEDAVRDQDFISWFESLLPYSFHPLVLDASVRERCWAERNAAVEAAGRTNSANQHLASNLARRCRENSGSPWVGPIIDDLERLPLSDPYLIPELRAAHVRRAEAREEQRRQHLGAATTRADRAVADGTALGRVAPDTLFDATMRALRDVEQAAHDAAASDDT